MLDRPLDAADGLKTPAATVYAPGSRSRAGAGHVREGTPVLAAKTVTTVPAAAPLDTAAEGSDSDPWDLFKLP
eukprot:6741341-Lingulodinium_polyedra.AAC.1